MCFFGVQVSLLFHLLSLVIRTSTNKMISGHFLFVSLKSWLYVKVRKIFYFQHDLVFPVFYSLCIYSHPLILGCSFSSIWNLTLFLKRCMECNMFILIDDSISWVVANFNIMWTALTNIVHAISFSWRAYSLCYYISLETKNKEQLIAML